MLPYVSARRRKPTTTAQAVIQLDGAVDSTSDDVDISVSQPTVDIDITRVKFVGQHDGAHDKLLLS